MATHLYAYRPGWSQSVVYGGEDPRLPEAVRDFNRGADVQSLAVAPLVLGGRNLGWIGLSSAGSSDCEVQWRVAVLEAMARQATLALHQSRLSEQRRLEERRKAILEERNRLARDIHDNLAQGFAAILMQLQAAQREAGAVAPAVAASIETAVHLARTHMTEARRSVSSLRPNVGDGEDIRTALKRIADVGRRTNAVPIDLQHRRAAPLRRRRRARDHRHRAGSADQRAPSFARPSHHHPRVDRAIDRLPPVGRRRRPRDCQGCVTPAASA